MMLNEKAKVVPMTLRSKQEIVGAATGQCRNDLRCPFAI